MSCHECLSCADQSICNLKTKESAYARHVVASRGDKRIDASGVGLGRFCRGYFGVYLPRVYLCCFGCCYCLTVCEIFDIFCARHFMLCVGKGMNGLGCADYLKSGGKYTLNLKGVNMIILCTFVAVEQLLSWMHFLIFCDDSFI